MTSTQLASRYTRGGNGIHVFSKSYGNPDGRAIIFIHGTSCCHEFWRLQTGNEDLAKKYHMIAVDLRGHGFSESPHDDAAYDNHEGWAEDLNAVINDYGLEKPVIVGWSFGSTVLGYYLRKYGDAALGGSVWVSAVSNGVAFNGEEVLGPAYPAIFEEFTNDSLSSIYQSAKTFIETMVHVPGTGPDYAEFIAATMMARPTTRKAMFAAFEHDEYLQKVSHPALVIHGTEDTVLFQVSGEHVAKQLPNADLKLYSDVNHVPFWENTEQFNADLQAYVDGLP